MGGGHEVRTRDHKVEHSSFCDTGTASGIAGCNEREVLADILVRSRTAVAHPRRDVIIQRVGFDDIVISRASIHTNIVEWEVGWSREYCLAERVANQLEITDVRVCLEVTRGVVR